MKISTCKQCGKMLCEHDTVWAGAGLLFCSKDCGVMWAMCEYEEHEYNTPYELRMKATAYFEDIAEEVDVDTVGIKREIWPAYSASSDITTIMRSAWENDELLFTEVVGFYFGPPDEDATELYVDKTRATFIRCEDLRDTQED